MEIDGTSRYCLLCEQAGREIGRLKAENAIMSKKLDELIDIRLKVFAFVESRKYADAIYKSDSAVKPLFDYVESINNKGE